MVVIANRSTAADRSAQGALGESGRGWPAESLLERFGPIPMQRICMKPAPGTAVEQDVVELEAHEDRLCELIDGVLLEKTVGYYESYLASLIGALLVNHVRANKLGVVTGADGLMRLWPGEIRIPDAAFVSNERLPAGGIAGMAIADFAPDLAVEVISASNSAKEMTDKLADYFKAGVRLVWYIFPKEREVHVYTAPHAGAAPSEPVVLGEGDTLAGGNVLPDFKLDLASYFSQ